MPFYARWHSTRQSDERWRHVNILHIGASHVQGGVLPHTVRSRFSPSADLGVIFPFRAINTNNPGPYTISYTGLWSGSRCISSSHTAALGLTGAAAMTSDKTATLTIDMRDDGRWAFERLCIMGERSDTTVMLYLTTERGDTIYADEWLSNAAYATSFGPAPTYSQDTPLSKHRPWVFELKEQANVVTIHFRGLKTSVPPKLSRKNYHPLSDSHYFILRGIMPVSPRTGITYHSSGINGASLSSWLRCSEHFEHDLRLLPPDLVIFGIGINDAHVDEKDFDPNDFKAKYRKLVDRIRTVNPNCCFIWITNNDTNFKLGTRKNRIYKPNPNGPRVREAMLELAAEYDAAVFDVFSLMGGMNSVVRWQNKGLIGRNDRVHFTPAGYKLIGNCLFDAILEDYSRYYKD